MIDFLKALPPAYLVAIVFLVLLGAYLSTPLDPTITTMLQATFYAFLTSVGLGGVRPNKGVGENGTDK